MGTGGICFQLFCLELCVLLLLGTGFGPHIFFTLTIFINCIPSGWISSCEISMCLIWISISYGPYMSPFLSLFLYLSLKLLLVECFLFVFHSVDIIFHSISSVLYCLCFCSGFLGSVCVCFLIFVLLSVFSSLFAVCFSLKQPIPSCNSPVWGHHEGAFSNFYVLCFVCFLLSHQDIVPKRRNEIMTQCYRSVVFAVLFLSAFSKGSN